MRHLKQTLAFAAAMTLCACNVEPDMSNRFTFTGQTVTDFLLSNDSIFSSFNYILRRSGQDRILSSYGNYTCFAPKNGAVEAYIDSLWNDRESVDEDGNLLHNGLTDNSLEGLTDSLCTDIAMYHLMKTELTTTQMLTAGGATYRTMLGRFITAGGRGSQILVNEGAPIDRQMCDNKVENGIVHAIGRCIPRSNRMVVQELKADSAHFAIFYEALCATGIDALLAEDDKQLAAPAPDPVAGYYTPTVCKRGFTLFAEPDAVFHANGIHSLADLAERCREWYGKCATGQRSMDEGWYDWFRNNNIAVDTGDDYTKENNVLHMFVAYHVLRAAVNPDILAFKKNTYVGNGWLGEAYDYYETMLPKTLVKAWMVYDKATGRYNTLLNRYVRNNTLTDGVETLGSDAMHEVVAEGIGMDLDAVKRPLNGYIYPLDGILLYDGKVPLGVLNERLRFDALTLCRETMDNGFRGATISEITALNAGKSAPRIRYPIDYFDNVKVFNGNNTKFDQTVVPDPDGKAWALYKADSFQGMGVFDFAIKLPPVPDGTYELRVDLDCMEHGSMVQYYLGDTPDINAFEPLGVPMDMRIPQNDFTDPRVVAMGCVPLDDPENYPEAYADRGVFMVRAADPAGPWSDPLMVIEGKGYIDTTPLWDDDGRCYLVNGWANSRIGFNGVLTVRELSADGTRPIGDPCIVFDGDATRNVTTEGPKFYKRDGWYWILCPAGGVAGGWQLAMRSRSPYGPYEWRRVLQRGTTAVNGPHQGGWVHTVYGEDWFVHFQDKGPYGRVCHLQPVDWSSGWPVMGRGGEPVLTHRKPKSDSKVVVNPAESDEFGSPRLGLQWQWQADYDDSFGQTTGMGFYRLFTFNLPRLGSVANLWLVPNMLLQKTPADEFTATARISDFCSRNNGQYMGLICMSAQYSSVGLMRTDSGFELQVRHNPRARNLRAADSVTVVATLAPTAKGTPRKGRPAEMHIGDVYLRMTVRARRVSYAYSTDGRHWHRAGSEYAMGKGRWIGSKIDFFAADPNGSGRKGFVDIDWFRVGR